MARLFIGIALPPTLAESLADVQPKPVAGMRLAAARQMHLTLHFIGEAEIARIADILRLVKMQPQKLAVAGVGQFSQGAVLWAGVLRDKALLKLHADIGRALAKAGVATEARPYKPHITLARCKPQVSRNIIDDFLERNAALQLAPVAVRQFALYSSNASREGPIYRVEKWFPVDNAKSIE